MNDFWHYVNTTPMKDYPWWGFILLALFMVAFMVALWGFNMLVYKWARRR
jgi:hypothetical protein